MLRGVDVSKWQNVGEGDYGKDFVICRASYGVGYTDERCDMHYQRAKSQGKLLGVYHYAYPQYNNPIDEADWFVSQVQGYIKEAMLILDFEELIDPNWAKQWLDRVYEKTGVKPVIYMNAYTCNNYDWSNISKDYGLWLAGYPNEYNVPNPPEPPENYMPYNIGSWDFVIIWQYSSSAGGLDRDVAYIDSVAWSKYAGSYVEPKPVIVTPEEPINEGEDAIPAKNMDVSEYIDKLKEIAKENKMPFKLPQKLYEFFRWLLWIVMPALSILLAGLNEVWAWNLPIDKITMTIDIVSVAIGAILGIAKLSHKE